MHFLADSFDPGGGDRETCPKGRWDNFGLYRKGGMMRARALIRALTLAVGPIMLATATPGRADDADGDGVDDAVDVCNNTPAGTLVDAEGRPVGDLDLDCDTDLDDFANFEHGFTGPLAAPAPPNDDCANAIELTGMSTNAFFDTTDATFDGSGVCMTSANIWYTYTAPCSGLLTVDLFGSSYDTMLGVYAGSGCESLSLVECNDDVFGGTDYSLVEHPIIAGTSYTIEVGGSGVAAGPGVITLGCSPHPIPSNDDCADASAIGDVTELAVDTTLATIDGPGTCVAGTNVWYAYTAPCTGTATASMSGSTFDTMLGVYNGAACDSLTLIGCDVESVDGGLTAEVQFDAVAGNVYLIEVGGDIDDFGGEEFGESNLTVSCVAAPSPPNDDCADASAIGDVTDLAFDTTYATFDGSGLCLTSPNIWYAYTAPCTGTATVDTFGSSFDTMLGVHSGAACDSLTVVGCNDDAPGGELQSELAFDTVAGHVYMVEVGGFDSTVGEGFLSISCVPASGPSNDDCANATQFSAISVNAAFDTTNATFDGDGACLTSPNLWYAYTAPCTGTLTIDTFFSSYDTVLGVYSGPACGSLAVIACNDNAPGSVQSEISFAAIAGNVYTIEVGGAGSAAGVGQLNILCTADPIPSNDDCDSGTAIGDVTDLAFDTTYATFDGDGACLTSPNLWYAYTAPCTGTATADLFGSSFDTMLGVHSGAACDSLTVVGCNDDAPGGELQSELAFDTVAGHVYMVEVGGFDSTVGEGLLSISCVPASGPSNDDCANATEITGATVNSAFDTTLATFDGSGACMTSPNLWYAYTAPCTGTLTIDLLGSSFDTMLAVYTGAACDSLALVGCNDDAPGGGHQSEVILEAIAGERYMVEVGGYGSATGVGQLNISCDGG
jgi:hypothetical protein